MKKKRASIASVSTNKTAEKIINGQKGKKKNRNRESKTQTKEKQQKRRSVQHCEQKVKQTKSGE